MNWISGATAAEIAAPMNGDAIVATAQHQATLAITVNAAPLRIWQVLIEGLDRHPSARRWASQARRIVPQESLTLSGRGVGILWSLELALLQFAPSRTRLVARLRVLAHRAPASWALIALKPAALVMIHRVLRAIKSDVELPAEQRRSADWESRRRRSVRATRHERRQPLPGDEMIPCAAGEFTNAIDIDASAESVWPWLVQMGAGRAGWYSYDALDNGGVHSAELILPRLQHPMPGSIFPALPGRRDGFELIACERNQWLILGWPDPRQGYVVTWTFVLRKLDRARTRLIVRARGSAAYRFHRLPRGLSRVVVHGVHFIMERKQLIEIARRAEGRAHVSPKAA